MNIILKDILTARNNHYVHTLEVDSVESLKSTIEQLVWEFEDKYSHADIIDFITSLDVIHNDSECLTDSGNEVYNFCVQSYVEELLRC